MAQYAIVGLLIGIITAYMTPILFSWVTGVVNVEDLFPEGELIRVNGVIFTAVFYAILTLIIGALVRKVSDMIRKRKSSSEN